MAVRVVSRGRVYGVEICTREGGTGGIRSVVVVVVGWDRKAGREHMQCNILFDSHLTCGWEETSYQPRRPRRAGRAYFILSYPIQQYNTVLYSVYSTSKLTSRFSGILRAVEIGLPRHSLVLIMGRKEENLFSLDEEGGWLYVEYSTVRCSAVTPNLME